MSRHEQSHPSVMKAFALLATTATLYGMQASSESASEHAGYIKNHPTAVANNPNDPAVKHAARDEVVNGIAATGEGIGMLATGLGTVVEFAGVAEGAVQGRRRRKQQARQARSEQTQHS